MRTLDGGKTITPTQMSDFQAKLARHPLWRLIEPQHVQNVLRMSEWASFQPRKTVLRMGEPPTHAFFLAEGTVRVFHRRGRREILVKLFRAPALFGEMEVLCDIPFLEYVTTLERSHLLRVPAQAFRFLVKQQRSFAAALVEDLSARLCIATVNERSLMFDDVEARVIDLLCDYAALYSAEVLDPKINQRSLASDLGVSRKAVAAAFASLQRGGLVKKVGRTWRLDMASLRQKRTRALALGYALDEKIGATTT